VQPTTQYIIPMNFNVIRNIVTQHDHINVVDHRELITRDFLARRTVSIIQKEQTNESTSLFSYTNLNMVSSTNAALTSSDDSFPTSDLVSLSSAESTHLKGTLYLHARGRKRSRVDAEEALSNPIALGETSQPIALSSKREPKMKRPKKDMDPETYVQQLFETFLGFALAIRPTLDLSTQTNTLPNEQFFPALTDDNLIGYEIDVITAVREEDLNTIRTLYQSGRTMSCSNRFGESLIHMACRRGFTSIVKFLVEEANVPIRITDDCGRTPLHDTLWNRDCKYEIFDMLVTRDPALLLVSDKRGHTPFAYARKEHWGNWLGHLFDLKDGLKESLDSNVMELFRKESLIL